MAENVQREREENVHTGSNQLPPSKVFSISVPQMIFFFIDVFVSIPCFKIHHVTENLSPREHKINSSFTSHSAS